MKSCSKSRERFSGATPGPKAPAYEQRENRNEAESRRETQNNRLKGVAIEIPKLLLLAVCVALGDRGQALNQILEAMLYWSESRKIDFHRLLAIAGKELLENLRVQGAEDFGIEISDLMNLVDDLG